MTNEEAIKWIKQIQKVGYQDNLLNHKESLDMAIEALEQKPQFYPLCEDCNKKMDEIRRVYDKYKEQETCTDAISRKYIQEKYATCADMLHPDADIVMEWVDEAPPVRVVEKTGQCEETTKHCEFCTDLYKGDTLYQKTSWDGGIGFDYIYMNFCPICGRKLEKEGE